MSDQQLVEQAAQQLDGLWPYLNSKGEVRLESVRSPRDGPALDLDDQGGLRTLERLFSLWVCDDEYMLLESEDETGSRMLHAIKAAKRGNDVYVERIGERLHDLESNVAAFAGYPMTGVLHVVLTYARESSPKRIRDKLRRPPPGGIEEAWLRVGEDFNVFMTNLRKWAKTAAPDANVFQIRSWEAHEKAWPHVDVLLCFSKIGFYAWPQKVSDSVTKYRVEDETRAKIRELWGCGYVDVQAVPSSKVGQRLRDVLWYVTKDSTEADYRTIDVWTEKKRLGLSIGWYTGRRVWSASTLLTMPAYRPGIEPAHELENVPIPGTAESWRCVRCGTITPVSGPPPDICSEEVGGCQRTKQTGVKFVPATADFPPHGDMVRDRFQEHIDDLGYHPETCLVCRKAWRKAAGDLTRAVSITQTNLAGEVVLDSLESRIRWTFIGMIKARDAALEITEWHKILPIGSRKSGRKLREDERGQLCASCSSLAKGVMHHEDADEDVLMCLAHLAKAREGYPEWVDKAWVPKRMKKSGPVSFSNLESVAA